MKVVHASALGLLAGIFGAAQGLAFADDDCPLPAATPAEMASLTNHRVGLAELTDFALAHHPTTRAAWAAAQVDDAGIGVALSQLFPLVTVDATGALQRTGNAASNAGNPAVDQPVKIVRTFTPTVALNWVLFDFGGRLDTLDAARYQALASRLAADRTLQTVANQVELAYFNLLGARQTVLADQASVDSAEESLDSAQSLLNHGVGTLGDVAQAQAYLSSTQLLLIRARSTVHSDSGALNYAVGVPVSFPLNVDIDDNSGERPTSARGLSAAEAFDPSETVDRLLDRARQARPDLVAYEAQLRQAQAELAAVRASGLPSLTLGASADRRYANNSDPRSTQALMLSLSLPLFDGGLVHSQAGQSKARIRQLQAERDLQRAAVDLDVWQSFQQASINDAAMASARVGLDSALTAERSARQRYQAGITTFLEVLSTQASTAQARLNLVQARYDALTALSNLGYAIGATTTPRPQGLP